VALILKKQILVGYTLLVEGGDYLLGLRLLDARVVGPLGNEEGYLYTVYVEEWRAGLEELLFCIGVADALVERGQQGRPVGWGWSGSG